MNTNKTSASYPIRVSYHASKNQRFINLDYLKEISSGNETFIEVLLKAFQSESKRFLHQLKNQLSSDDFPCMAKTAHSMKPTGVYIGADCLTLMVAELEQAARAANHRLAGTLISQIQKLIDNILKEIDQYLTENFVS